MLLVTADTNVIISGLNFGGQPRRILELAEQGLIRLAVSDEILQEVAGVLRREKFGWPEDEIRKALSQIDRFAEHIAPRQKLEVITEDPSDNRILECAVSSGSDYLVTGDAHLLKLGRYLGVTIIKPADFLDLTAGVVQSR